MLFVISSLSYDTTLLPHFLRYYRTLGATSFIISVQELIPGILKKAQRLAKQFDCDIRWIPVTSRQALTGIEANNKEEIRAHYVSPEDWIIPADLDEFIQFPAPLTQLIKELNDNDATFIKGDFCDRISSTGRLNKTLPEPSIWDQFPLVCTISSRLLRCWCHKVVLCRGDCVLSSGHHNVITPARPLLNRRSKIHHFKWRSGILKALRRRVAIYKTANLSSYRESERAVSYLNINKKINLHDFNAQMGWNPNTDGLPTSSIIYTSITNSYDNLKELPQIFKGSAEAVALIDDPPDSVSWQFLPACSEYADPCRNAKKPKILPHLYFPDAEYSLWIDGSIRVLSHCTLSNLIENYLADSDIALFKHRQRRCLYQEAQMCIQTRRDSLDTIHRQMIRYRYENFPQNRGLAECCVILRRHSDKIKLLNELWWDEICRHSRRDQLSFDFVCWKLGIRYKCFPGSITNNAYFRLAQHEKRDRGLPPVGFSDVALSSSSSALSAASEPRPRTPGNLSPKGRRMPFYNSR
jgi:hypothetical protein